MTANMKVNAGVRVPIAEARDGELNSMPLYAQILAENLPFSQNNMIRT